MSPNEEDSMSPNEEHICGSLMASTTLSASVHLYMGVRTRASNLLKKYGYVKETDGNILHDN